MRTARSLPCRQNSGRSSSLLTAPVRRGNKLMPSSCHSGSTTPPATAANVGKKSSDITGSSIFVPALICPGQRMHIGTRMPPSNSEPLRPRSLPLLAPVNVWPPLSLVNTTSVFSAKPAACSACSTLPTLSSNALTRPAYLRRFNGVMWASLARSSSLACNGPCGAVNDKNSKNGWFLFSLMKRTPASPRRSVV